MDDPHGAHINVYRIEPSYAARVRPHDTRTRRPAPGETWGLWALDTPPRRISDWLGTSCEPIAPKFAVRGGLA